MGLLNVIWRGLKGVGKWAVDHPETVTGGISILDARRRSKSKKHDSAVGDYSLANLSERIRQLEDTLEQEISAVRNDLHTVSENLRTEYTDRLESLSRQAEALRVAQLYQAKAMKYMVFIHGGILCALIGCIVFLFLK